MRGKLAVLASAEVSTVALTVFGVIEPIGGGEARFPLPALACSAVAPAGELLKVFTPPMVWVEARATYVESAKSRVRNCAAWLVGTSLLRMAPMVVVGALGTTQYSESVVPSSSLKMAR